MIVHSRFSLKTSLLTTALALIACPALAETVTLRFVQTNDIDRMEERDGRGGFAKLAAVVARERAEGTTFLYTPATRSRRPFSRGSTRAHTRSTS
jgi:2',3'-cyclic-nucleotide 2'-phosphodiesterase (5'-nucleotidase family)